MEGFTKGIKIGPNLEQKAKKGSCYTKDPTKELEERKRFGIVAAAREILKEMLSLPLYMYQEQRTPNIPGLVHTQDIEEVNASVNADESVEMGWLVFMICVVVWVLLDTCLMEFLQEMEFLSMTDGYSKRNCWDETSKLFDSMSVEGNVEPEEVTMIAARSACSQKGGLRLGESFHEYVKLEM
ncbi:hypothetical protein Peur_058285 [Populus x canadensis]